MINYEKQEPPQFLPMQGLDLLKQIIELNQSIVKQNSLIVQALSLPPMILTSRKDKE